MMGPDRGLETSSCPAVHAVNQGSAHEQSLRAVAGGLALIRPLGLELLVDADRPLEHRVGVLPSLRMAVSMPVARASSLLWMAASARSSAFFSSATRRSVVAVRAVPMACS
jgi:hypothetical protein